MSRVALVSVEEHLSAGFPDGDGEFVDGPVVERRAGEIDHAAKTGRGYACAGEGGRAGNDGVWGAPDPAVQLRLCELYRE